jgi:predicted O-methyltransferase YrrM
LESHFERRRTLYRHLGIVPNLLEGKRVIEFGPGGGHNAIYTASLKPATYVLVDANPSGLESTRALLSRYAHGTAEIQIVDSLIQDFESDEPFDLVLCEGVIPLQLDPDSFAKHIASFATPGGLVVVTCMGSVAQAAENIRRCAACLLMEQKTTFADKLELLMETFGSHLETLQGMSRLHEDWILDNLVNPWVGPLFSIPEAIEALTDEFDAYGFSPSFVTDWSWFKDTLGADFRYHTLPIETYNTNVHNFIDHRYTMASRPVTSGAELVSVSDSLYKLYQSFDSRSTDDFLNEAIESTLKLANMAAEFSSETAGAFEDCSSAFVRYKNSSQFGSFGRFTSLWGRGQQYVSFIKR